MAYFGCFRFSTVMLAAIFSGIFTTIFSYTGVSFKITYAKPGDNVMFSTIHDHCSGRAINLLFIPDGFDSSFEFDILDTRQLPSAAGTRSVPYKDRLRLSYKRCCHGIWLQNVSTNDAGIYNSCGFYLMLTYILVIVEAPVNASITVEGALIDGHDVKLCCSANTLTRPSSFRKPTKFRWFELRHGLNDTQEIWTEIHEGHKKEFFERNENDDDDDETDGSGWGQAKFTKGPNSESLHEVLEISPLSRKDDGRRIACSAMEDFNLWSDKSPELVLSLEWKPTHRDLSLVPNVTHTTLLVGDSIDVICVAACRPECNVTWEKIIAGNKTVTLTENSTLSLHNVSHDAHGVYRCRGSNVHGSAHVHWKLSVAKADKHWLSETSHKITVVAIVTVALAFGIAATAMVVLRYRKRRSFTTWSHQRLFSVSDIAPSLSDHKETADSSSADRNAAVSSL